MNYNMSFTDGALNLFTMTTGASTMLSDAIPLLLLAMVFLVSFAGFYKGNIMNDWIISSFITTVVSGLMFFLGLLSWEYSIIPLTLFIGSILVAAFTDS